MRPIGYYVHHHGDGHRQRALAIARALRVPVTLLGTGLAGRTGEVPCIDLPDDRLGDGFDGRDGAARPPALHYAPIDHDGVRRRVALVTEWIARARPALMVIDVSVEMAMLARLASVPTIYVRLNGRRDDAAHEQAFAGAAGLLAPFAESLDDPETADAVRAKSFYAPGILPVAVAVAGEGAPDLILGVIGKGGSLGDGELWAAAARAVPQRRWRVIGECSVPAAMPGNLELCGWVDAPEAELARAGLMVGGAGDGLVGSVIGAGRPFICIPEARPYDEQRSKARRLATLGAAVVRADWPDAADWPGLVAQAEALGPRALAALGDAEGAARAARWLESKAAEMAA